MVYRTKLGTIPYANVVTSRPLVIGERIWVPDTNDFKPVRPRFKMPKHSGGFAACIVDRISEDVLFLIRH